jgi:hypothetical protein
MKHIMLDLETMGLRSNAAIVSIGACHFTADAIDPIDFHLPISLASCLEAGLTTDQSTIDWWAKQSVGARMSWQNAAAGSLLDVMGLFGQWLRSKGDPIAIWGNGAGFDPVLLDSVYKALEADPPWKYWNVYCFRTMKNIHKDVSAPPFLGEKHTALADAVHQAQHLQKILKLKGIQLP